MTAKRAWLILLLLLMAGCSLEHTSSEEDVQQSTAYPVLSTELEEEWTLSSVMEDETLLVFTYEHVDGSRIELVHDPAIQGMDHRALREYVLSPEHTLTAAGVLHHSYMSVNHFVGEWQESEALQKTHFTFLERSQVFEDHAEVYYQIIAEDVPKEKMIQFIDSLDTV
ncbi:hypothetical protein [Alkalicoccus urumqiensis]|uniref:DUF4367 domain-containing protein n=1 Tax=Alkalicoccus urumqiensis TaxID=1548213 RepID=A0A2P6MEK8_ALKUR|nr:hypothetical protein [Alkalicoccus urumqiensis]PRO64729.1 hypothetical protein C6I21_13570 [Alkalicoccus urumqiensis]